MKGIGLKVQCREMEFSLLAMGTFIPDSLLRESSVGMVITNPRVVGIILAVGLKGSEVVLAS